MAGVVRSVLTVGVVASCACACVVACEASAGSPASPEPPEHPSIDASTPDATSDARGDDLATDAGGADGSPQHPFPGASADCGLGGAGEPVDLGCTGLYADWASKTIAAGVEAYAPAFASWNDGATGPRWIALPPGTTIDTSDMDEWTFPVDTRIWQEMQLALGGGSAATRVETRLLWKKSAGTWIRTTYRWSDDGQTSAAELSGGEQNVGGTPYEVPFRFECDECHNGRLDGVLGFDAVSLSAPGATGLTMQALVARGLLSAPPASPVVVPGNAVESAALGWLHANCGEACHNDRAGSAGNSGLLLRLDVATLASVQATNAYVTGWNVLAKSYVIPDATASYRIHACDPATSAAYTRAAVRDGVGGVTYGTQMPNLLTHVVDVEGLASFGAWIDQGCDGGP